MLHRDHPSSSLGSPLAALQQAATFAPMQEEADTRCGDASGSVTQLLRQVAAGAPGAEEALYAVVYDQLLQRARLHRASGTLNPTALVHEAYLKLTTCEGDSWKDRNHFLAVAATAMRHILVDHARRADAEKRRHQTADIDPDDRPQTRDTMDAAVKVMAVDEALTKLARFDPKLAQLVTLHWFADLPFQECATALDCSERSCRRLWKTACAWLTRELDQ